MHRMTELRNFVFGKPQLAAGRVDVVTEFPPYGRRDPAIRQHLLEPQHRAALSRIVAGLCYLVQRDQLT